MGNTGGIIQGDNCPEHCFVPRNLILMNFFEYVVIMKLKTCTTGKIFGKIYLKPIRDAFFQYLVCNQGRDGMRYGRTRENSIFC